MKQFFEALDEQVALLTRAREALCAPMERAAELCRVSLLRRGKLLACGNGGSAALAQHFVAELLGRYEDGRAPLPAIALHADAPTTTAIANDFGFEHLFARQIEALGRPGDVLVALSTSGSSPNVVRAAASAKKMGLAVVAFTGRGGGALSDLADALVMVPSDRVPRVQEVHELCLHALAHALEVRG